MTHCELVTSNDTHAHACELVHTQMPFYHGMVIHTCTLMISILVIGARVDAIDITDQWIGK